MDANEFMDGYRIPFNEEAVWRKYLQDNGFVVIANYLNQEQCEQYVDKFWSIMEVLSGKKLSKQDGETHGKDDNYPPLLHGGMIQYVGHSQPQWDLRKKCKPIFQRLWFNEDLKTSFDGFCFMNGKRKYEKRQDNAFLHCDQSPLKNYLWSYQGIMTLTDSGENQGGYVCVPKSHLYHQKYFQEKGLMKHKRDWYKVPQEEKYKEPLCYDRKINTKAGDFILFDSRTFHCNTVPMMDNLRICTYICMLPSKKVPPMVKQARKKAVEERRTTCHHPGDGFRTFAEIPKEAEDAQEFKNRINSINVFQMDEGINCMI